MYLRLIQIYLLELSRVLPSNITTMLCFVHFKVPLPSVKVKVKAKANSLL